MRLSIPWIGGARGHQNGLVSQSEGRRRVGLVVGMSEPNSDQALSGEAYQDPHRWRDDHPLGSSGGLSTQAGFTETHRCCY